MSDDPKGLRDDVTQILSRPTGQMDRKALLESLRRNVTVLFTDLKGSTSYFEKYGDAAGLMMVHRCNTMIRAFTACFRPRRRERR